jgi:hypothetical protein
MSAMAGCGWVSVADLVEIVRTWRAFRPPGRRQKLSADTLARIVRRTLGDLVDLRLVEDHPQPPTTKTGLRIRTVRRTDERDSERWPRPDCPRSTNADNAVRVATPTIGDDRR